MLVTYDTLVDAMYIKLKPEAVVAKTVELDDSAILDLDKQGDLVGIEVLNMRQKGVLRQIAIKYHRPELRAIDMAKLHDAVTA